MAQAITRNQSQQESRNPSKNETAASINWNKVKMVVQSLLLLAMPVTALWFSIKNDYLFTSEIASATLIIALIVFVRLIGGRN